VDDRRRQFLTEQGEPLILAHSPMTLVERYSHFIEATGLDEHLVTANPLVTVPMPVFNKASGPRGWPENLNPEMLWHPLFWLPPRVALRYRFEDAEAGDGGIESEDEWVVRVGLELTLSNLYDPADGTWLDILSVIGLDSEDAATHNRLRFWLQGIEDADLDSIDLSVLTDLPATPHWALESAAELLPTLQPASWAVLADNLAQSAGEIAMDVTEIDDARNAVSMLVNLALGTLRKVPAATEGENAPRVRWAEIAESLPSHTGDIQSLVSGELEELSESFYSIRDDYWPFVEALHEEITDQGDELDTELKTA
jgi:hypothetical protein